MNKKSFVTFGFIGILIALGTADALLTGERILSSAQEQPTDDARDPVEITVEKESMGTTSSSAVSSSAGTKKGQRRVRAPNVAAVLKEHGFEGRDTNELMLIRTVIPQEEATVRSQVLLKDGDRAGILAWTESPKVKLYFLGLKETLHVSFSTEVTDLIDETLRPAGQPVRNLISFLDPGISPERLVFVRVRDRLYEVHVAEGADEEMFELIEALSH